jgi:hypothetical protein
MKKLLLSFFVLASLASKSQYYQFTMNTGTYTNITGGTVLINDNWHYFSRLFKTPFTFRFFTSNITDSIEVINFSSIFFNNINNGFFDPYNVELQSRGNTQSPVSYVTTGSSPSRILKIEFNNAGFASDPGLTDNINFQVWIYETSNIIEFHYGPNSVKSSSYGGDTGPIVQLADPMAPSTNYIILEGNPANPTLNTTHMQTSVAMLGSPANGQIYRFTPSAYKTGINLQANSELHILNQNISIPEGQLMKTISLMDMNGNLVTKSADPEKISMESLPHGIYLLSIETNAGIVNRKLIW